MGYEKTQLDEHLKEVVDIKVRLDTHPCPCIWSDWGAWDACSKSCGHGATKSRKRAIAKPALNNGNDCYGKPKESKLCHLNPCPIDCVWGNWGDWNPCPSGCKDGTDVQEKTRVRVMKVEAAHGGKQCVGDKFDAMKCTQVEELKEKISALVDVKKVLEEEKKELKDQNGQLEKELEGKCVKGSTNPTGSSEKKSVRKARVNEENGLAEVFYNGKWSPICGLYFWDAGWGVKLFCSELTGEPIETASGRIEGRRGRQGRRLEKTNAIFIGRCTEKDESIFKCSGDKGNFRGRCNAGNDAGIKIHCNKNT